MIKFRCHRNLQHEEHIFSSTATRPERGEDAGAAVSDQQVRPAAARYPVDRYLVESSNKIEDVNLIDDCIWNPEPMLNPEDEIILRKLHDMLQSTADDLKLLSGELSKYHEPGVQVKTLPTPLDEEFNEKIHIEEIVNAKFHGYKIVDSTPPSPNIVLKDSNNKANTSNTKKFVDTSVQVNYMPTLKKHTLRSNLGISRTKIVQIHDNSRVENEIKPTVKNNSFRKKNAPAVEYNELSYKYVEPKIASSVQRPLTIQDMPSINIRSELTKQKVLQMEIIPDTEKTSKNAPLPSNALVLTMEYKPEPRLQFDKSNASDQNLQTSKTAHDQPNVRKVSKMSTCESSESTNNNSSEPQHQSQRYIRKFPKITRAANQKSQNVPKKELKRSDTNLGEWQKKLNAVYGRPKSSTTFKTKKGRKAPHKSLTNQSKLSKDMNNSEYIPYSKLTLGGVSVSDIEREICDIPNRNNITISPILDKILSSRENSFHMESSPRKQSPKILTTSDENLLQEVIDIEYQVTNTLSSKVKNINKSIEIIQNTSKGNKESDSYVDDFEDDQSEGIQQSQSDKSESAQIEPSSNNSLNEENINNSDENTHNKTYTKTTNLSFKNSVDIFEFVHSIDTQETATQSNTSNKISPKETQTSPRNDQSNLKPIHNDLWPSIDSKNEVEKMFNLEKDFIKKLILEEYGDLLDKNKPSTSKSEFGKSEINEAVSAKNTQTSPAHVKSVMTSPTRTKTRTTSPFALSVAVTQQTSPMIVVPKEEQFKVEIDDDDELGISVNLSSPRFSLRLPQSSREVLANLEANRNNQEVLGKNNLRKSSSSSLNEDYSSSDISSLGQIGKKFKRKLRKGRIPSLSELSSSSSPSGCSSVPPLRSEGEASVGQLTSKKYNKNSRSEGEMSLGQYN